jgi:hypothetical protein
MPRYLCSPRRSRIDCYLIGNSHGWTGIDMSPKPVRHGQTPARRLRSAGKRTALARRTRLRRPPLICRRRGDETHFNPIAGFQLDPPHVGSYVMENLRTGPSSPSAASRTKCRSATWAWMTVQDILDEHIAKKLV